MRHEGGRNIAQANVRNATHRQIAQLLALLALLTACALTLPALAGAVEANTPPAGVAPVSTSPPTLTGNPVVGQTLTCAPGAWANNPTNFSYVWLRSGVPIAGQAASTYVVQPADEGHTIACRVTAANGGGNYTIIGLPSGSYNVSFSAGSFNGSGNYLFQYFSGQATAKAATAVTVTAPGATVGINAELQPGGEISGVVSAATGKAPVSGAEVCASEIGEGNGFGCAITGANGAYIISSLPTGSYKVSFFSGEGNFLSATSEGVSVTAGTVTPNVNAELATGGSISGKVVSAAGKAPLANVEVCAEIEVSELFGNCANTNSAGEYAIVALGTSSSYRVAFYPENEGQNFLRQYYNGKEKSGEATPVPVTAGSNTPNVNAELQAGGQISGKVVAAAGKAPIEKLEVCAEADISEIGFIFKCAATNAAGEYTIGGLSTGTTYVVRFGTGFFEQLDYVPQYYNGKEKSSEATPVPVTVGATTPNINAEMRAGGHISGVVTDATTHAALANASVCAAGDSSGAFIFQCATTNAAGEYTITGLSTGMYTVSFGGPEETGYVGQYFNGTPIFAQATLVSVTAGATTGAIDAALQVGGTISGRVMDAATHAGVANVTVCAAERAESPIGFGCATTATGAASASATSNAVTIAGGFKLAKKPVFDAKTDTIDFFFDFSTPGKLSWALFFRNADVGFADSLGISLGEGTAIAEVAKKHKGKGKKAKKCKKGEIKHHGKCKRLLVPFASGSENVPAGTVEVKVHADAKAIKALKSRHTLHVSGIFTFQPTFGGPPTHLGVSVKVKQPPKKHHHKKGKGKKH